MRLYKILEALANKNVEPYPVGAVYVSAVATTAAAVGEMFGGTWEQMGQGRVLMGAGSLQPNTNNTYGTVAAGEVNVSVGTRGGAAKAALPNHTHEQTEHNHDQEAHNHDQLAHNHTQDAHSHTPMSQTYYMTYSGTRGDGKGKSNIDSSGTYTYTRLSGSEAKWMGSTQTGDVEAKNQQTTATNVEKIAKNKPAKANILNTGEDPALKNLQPFEVVYFFKRVL